LPFLSWLAGAPLWIIWASPLTPECTPSQGKGRLAIRGGEPPSVTRVDKEDFLTNILSWFQQPWQSFSVTFFDLNPKFFPREGERRSGNCGLWFGEKNGMLFDFWKISFQWMPYYFFTTKRRKYPQAKQTLGPFQYLWESSNIFSLSVFLSAFQKLYTLGVTVSHGFFFRTANRLGWLPRQV
jgi:hypothetical protein